MHGCPSHCIKGSTLCRLLTNSHSHFYFSSILFGWDFGRFGPPYSLCCLLKILFLWIAKSNNTLNWDTQQNRLHFIFKNVFIFFHVWTPVRYAFSHIHLSSPRFKKEKNRKRKNNYNHYVLSQMAKKCGTNCLNMGKFLSWPFD